MQIVVWLYSEARRATGSTFTRTRSAKIVAGRRGVRQRVVLKLLSATTVRGVHASSTLSDRAHVKMARQQTLPLPVWILWCGLLGES